MPTNLNSLASSRTSWPHWNQRGRVKRVDSHSNIIEREWACNGEFVRISPRYVKNGSTYRIRPERPAAFFAAWLYERSLLPMLLTGEECEAEWALEILDPLWAAHKGNFFKLESPNAACDHATKPSHRVGFSFCILQVLVEQVGAVRGSNGVHAGMMSSGALGNGDNEALRKKIEEMRAKAGRTDSTPPKKK